MLQRWQALGSKSLLTYDAFKGKPTDDVRAVAGRGHNSSCSKPLLLLFVTVFPSIDPAAAGGLPKEQHGMAQQAFDFLQEHGEINFGVLSTPGT